jgi:RNA polymerase sigma factor (sigma-70 family)
MTGRERLLEELRPVAFAIAYRMLGSVAEAEDVVQEALLRVHQALEAGERIASPRAFVATVTTRLAINQLRSARAHRRPRFQTTREQREELARRFVAAAERGDLAGLEALLAHDVELTGDGGGKVRALARSLRGRAWVARALVNYWGRVARTPGVSLRPVEVNGGPGALVLDAQQRLLGVVALEVAGGQITSISGIVNPDKLTHLGPLGDLRSLLRSAR